MMAATDELYANAIKGLCRSRTSLATREAMLNKRHKNAKSPGDDGKRSKKSRQQPLTRVDEDDFYSAVDNVI